MSSTRTDRIDGVQASTALKAPCVAATTGNITLSGAQTIDGVAVVANNRVLVKDQTDAVENGIYIASNTAWERSPDFDGARDVVQGTRVFLNSGTTYEGQTWRVTTADPVVINTDEIDFEVCDLGPAGPTGATGATGPQGPTGATGPAGAGSGDVLGPATSTDNSLARFDGTDNKTLQGSAIIVDDSANLTGVTSITVANTGLHILDTNATHDLIIAPGSNLTADRTLTITTGDADRTIDISAASVTITTAGANLINDADATAQRTTLGLGTAATVDTGTSAGNAVVLDGSAKLPAVDGSQLINLPGASSGWVPIKTQTAANVSSVDFVNGSGGVVLDSTYKAYAVVITSLIPAADANTIRIRTSTNAGSSYDSGASDYGYAIDGNNTASAAIYRNSTGAAAIDLSYGTLGTSTGELYSAVVYLSNPSGAQHFQVSYTYAARASAAELEVGNGMGQRLAAADVDAIRFLMSSGNISSGTFTLYGIADA